MNVNIKIIPSGMLDVNCSIVSNPENSEAFLVDPGGDEQIIHNYLVENQLSLKAILHTHAHFDHIMGTASLINQYYGNDTDIRVYLHPEEQFLWDNVESQAMKFGLGLPKQTAHITHALTHNETLKLCDIPVRVLHTPGHSPGSCTFLISEPFVTTPVLIAGDVIFQGSIGRTDLWKGDYNALMSSIRDHILSYPDNTRIICGHGPDTTVGEERMYNPYLEFLRGKG